MTTDLPKLPEPEDLDGLKLITLPPADGKPKPPVPQNGTNEKSAEDAHETEPTDSQPKYKPDEDQLAQAIAQKWRRKVQCWHNNYRVYHTGVWKKISPQKAQEGIRRKLRAYRAHGIRVTHSLVTGVGRLLEGDLHVEDEQLNTLATERARHLNFTNGLLEIGSKELKPHRSDLYFTTQFPFAYDSDAECPTFIRFLRTSLVDPKTGKTDENMVALVWQAIFYSMTSSTTFKVSYWLVGLSGSGKSTLLAILNRIFGEMFATVDINQLNNDKYILAAIVGKLIIAFSEASVGSAIPDSLYKALVGGEDEVTIHEKYKPSFAYKPEAKLWWAMNEPPRNLDRSGALANRIKPILFRVSISPEKQDLQLVDKCAREASGIFNMCLPWGIRLLREGKFVEPEASHQWLEEYRLMNDPERNFVNEEIIAAPGKYLSNADLYRRYVDRAREDGFQPKSKYRVSADWKRLGLVEVRLSLGMTWKDVQLCPQTDF